MLQGAISLAFNYKSLKIKYLHFVYFYEIRTVILQNL